MYGCYELHKDSPSLKIERCSFKIKIDIGYEVKIIYNRHMNDNFFILCIDEIYAPNLQQLLKLTKDDIFSHPNHWHFGLSGVIFPAHQMAKLNLSIHALQKDFYPQKEFCILHYNDILNNKDCFTDLEINPSKKEQLVKRIKKIVKETEFKYIATFIDKHELVKKYGTFNTGGLIKDITRIKGNIYPPHSVVNYNLYCLALRLLIKKFYTFLKSQKTPARGLIIAEAIGTKEDSEMRDAFYKIQRSGISTISIKDLRQTVIDLLIVYKKQNHGGVQLADLLLYPTYDAKIPFHSVREDHFLDYESVIKPKLLDEDSIILFP